MAGENVVRRDVIQIEWDVGDNPLGDLTKQADELKASVTKINGDELQDMADSANNSASGFKKLLDGVKNVGVKVKDLAGSALTKAKSGLQSLAKISLNALKKGLDAAWKGLQKVATWAGKASLKLAKISGKAVLGGIAAATVAIGGLGVAAINGYGEYEQLVGGVETLFGKSQDQVMQYAHNAYKTAGLSANDYMETVTSFSASLLQSLDGDTAKAAKVADKAITDMADNANKMGTDMESIQHAYQGFAKQNYTMLDNLKLGYGGTKEEMARLLKDAEKISGQKFDMSSYADIVEAIHVVQTEMGITGTTAKEASSTIQGSANAMKAAWSNFLTGMADENQDFDVLVNNLVDSVTTFAGNLIPRITTLAPRLVKGIAQLGNTLIGEIPGIMSDLLPALATGAIELVNGLVSTIQSNLSMISGVAVSIVTQLATALLQMVPQIMVIGIQLIVSLVQGIAQQIPSLIPVAIDGILTIVNALTQNLPLIIDAALLIIMSLVEGLTQNIPTIIEAAINLIMSLCTGLIQALPLLVQGALQLIMALCMGLVENLPLLLQAAVQLIMGLVQGLLQSIQLIISAALQLITGLVQGLLENLPVIIQAAIQIIVALAVGLIQAIPQLLMAIPQIFGAFIDGIMNVNWLQVGWDILKSLGMGIVQGVADLGAGIWSAVKGIFGGGDNKSEAKTSGTETMSSYTSGLTSGTAGIASATSTVGTTLTNGLTTDLTGAGASTIGTYNTGITSGVSGISGVTQGVGTTISTDMNLDLNSQGTNTMGTFNTGLTSGGVTAQSTSTETANGIKTTFDNVDLSPSGKSIMSGLISGMNAMRGEVIATAKSIANAVSSTINEALDINSPSGVAEWQAEMVGKGLSGGLRKAQPAVQAASTDLSHAMYMPEQSAAATPSRSQTNHYSPSFTLNFSGNTDRTAERTVKQWIKDALEETFASMERTYPQLQEV